MTSASTLLNNRLPELSHIYCYAGCNFRCVDSTVEIPAPITKVTDCPNSKPYTPCLVDPCLNHECANGAVCQSSYCGGEAADRITSGYNQLAMRNQQYLLL